MMDTEECHRPDPSPVRFHGIRYIASDECEFNLWAPRPALATLVLFSPSPRTVPMLTSGDGYWSVRVPHVPEGTSYGYLLDDTLVRPDPASLFQPEGVHGPSQTIHHASFGWDDGIWRGRDLQSLVLYELHVGTFTPQGTLEAIIPRVGELVELGITAIELMPVAQFAGERNWGYDGVFPFAVQHSYGGPVALKRLVNECHRYGLSVVLDVVYNHSGPEGNYLRDFGPYFSESDRTPWGPVYDFYGPFSRDIQGFFIQNALQWLRDFHIDGLRLDAVHEIRSSGTASFLSNLSSAVDCLSRETRFRRWLFAESARDDDRLLTPRSSGGFGLDARWNDDFHHHLHVLLTHERHGYYRGFGDLEAFSQLIKSEPPERENNTVVVFSQNHDQVGNRGGGERLSTLVSFEALKLAAGVVLLSPHIPILFMGEEFMETAPFLYFCQFTDRAVIRKIQKGRMHEHGIPRSGVSSADPLDLQTFLRSKVNWSGRQSGNHNIMLRYYARVLQLRNTALFAHSIRKRLSVKVLGSTHVLCADHHVGHLHTAILMNFDPHPVSLNEPLSPGEWRRVLDSADKEWGGPGSEIHEEIKGTALLELRGYSIVMIQHTQAIALDEDGMMDVHACGRFPFNG